MTPACPFCDEPLQPMGSFGYGILYDLFRCQTCPYPKNRFELDDNGNLHVLLG